MQIVNRRHIFHGLIAEFIRGAATEGAFDPGAGHPDGEPFRVVIAAAGALLKGWHAAKFRGPKHQRVFEQPARFQILD